MAEADKDLTERELDALFAAARAHAPAPSEALMARILAEAEALMPAAAAAGPGEAPPRPREAGAGRLRAALAALGGWRAVGGLATAAGAGVWIGMAGLADPVALADGLLGASSVTVELMPGAEGFELAAGAGWE